MPPTRPSKPDRSRICLDDDDMARVWSRNLGRSREDIAAAIEKVGDNCETVRKELGLPPVVHAQRDIEPDDKKTA